MLAASSGCHMAASAAERWRCLAVQSGVRRGPAPPARGQLRLGRAFTTCWPSVLTATTNSAARPTGLLSAGGMLVSVKESNEVEALRAVSNGSGPSEMRREPERGDSSTACSCSPPTRSRIGWQPRSPWRASTDKLARCRYRGFSARVVTAAVPVSHRAAASVELRPVVARPVALVVRGSGPVSEREGDRPATC